jgi:hypothetical protein
MNTSPSGLQMTFSHWPLMEYLRRPSFSDSYLIVFEGANILGYCPGISLIVGLARMIFAVTALDDSGPDATVILPFTARGLAECTGLGVCLIPVDLVNTLLLVERRPKEGNPARELESILN